MNRAKVHILFRRNRGEIARLARELGVDDTSLSSWFAGKTNSTKISRAVYARAEELLAQEEQSTAVFRQQHPRLVSFANLQAAA